MQDYQFYWSVVFDAWPQLLSGAWVTLQITLLSVVIGMALALPMSVIRQSSQGWMYYATSWWVELSRNTPVLFQVYIMYFGLGTLGINISSYAAVLIAIAFNNAGYMTEIFRGGLNAIPRQQMATARSLGMTPREALRYVIFPQVFKVVFLPFVTQCIWAMLNTSMGMLIGLRELTGATQSAQSISYRTFEFFVVTAGIYYVIAKFIQFGALLTFRLMYRR
ncbi:MULTISPECIES: amino acid ABC transporter permease [unclassified Pantoea]|uniref:amino acid ABC transporter permease n=1 Tax=unclassified Pantoea TaxID=2630326 RepID=UPI00301BA8FC